MSCWYAAEAALTPFRCPSFPPPTPEDMGLFTSQEESIAAETEALEKRLVELSEDVTRQVGVKQ